MTTAPGPMAMCLVLVVGWYTASAVVRVPVPPAHPSNVVPVMDAYVTVVTAPTARVICIEVFMVTAAPIETIPVPPEQPVNVDAVTPVYVTVWTPSPDVTRMVPDGVGNSAVDATVMVATGNVTPTVTVVVAPVIKPSVEATLMVDVGNATPLLATAIVVRAPLVSALVPMAI